MKGRERARRRRCRPAPFPWREPSFLVVHACGRTRSGKRGCQRTGNPFIKALQACQTSSVPEWRGIPPPGLAT
ncbi:hypothetical protein CWN49_00350 [Klebsiella michiganensis]|uniref:Uncharacterized protein n=1 Tax=Klebsiella michiganensis TaxID=1134687 RepID=A0A2J5QBR7_9ENTR|nr:hypothetical protein CWN49_00350 [Klebsiella michiganensis]PPS48755.1 hypothetical protein BWR12_22210 [Citrobacter braakii]